LLAVTLDWIVKPDDPKNEPVNNIEMLKGYSSGRHNRFAIVLFLLTAI
jgi:hypothetical protein